MLSVCIIPSITTVIIIRIYTPHIPLYTTPIQLCPVEDKPAYPTQRPPPPCPLRARAWGLGFRV